MGHMLPTAQGRTIVVSRVHDSGHKSLKEINESREMTHPVPITVVKPRRNSASSSSLLFDMELSTSWKNHPRLSSPEQYEDHHHRIKTNSVITVAEKYTALSTDLQRKVMQYFTLLKGSCMSGQNIDLKLLVEKMEKIGFFVKLVGQDKPKKVKIELEFMTAVSCPFLMIFGHTSQENGILIEDHNPCILDPYFKAQFEIQHPSASYSTILAWLPEAFIGSLSSLESLVKVLCRELHNSFNDSGLPLPPWRVYKAMINHWSQPIQSNQKEEEYHKDPVVLVGST